MPRPKRRRCVLGSPGATFFKPRGIPMTMLERVVLTLDEFEALRLADLEGQYHEEAAGGMDVSRTTFGRVLASARRKLADALVNGKAVVIQHLPGDSGATEERQGQDEGLQRTAEVPRCPACGRPTGGRRKGERK